MNYRERIIEEASKMFRTYGIRAVAMDMLAGQMNISKRTIYEVFRDKDELLRGVLEWMAARQKEKNAEIMKSSDNVIEAIFRIINMMLDHFQKISPAFLMDLKRIHLEAIENAEKHNSIPYVDNNYEILKKGVEQGIFRNDINIELTNKCMLEVSKMTVDKEIFPPDHFQGSEVVKNLYISYLRGISTPKGLELIDKYYKTDSKAEEKNH